MSLGKAVKKVLWFELIWKFHPRNAQGGLPHLSEDKFGDHHQGYHGIHISDPRQGQQDWGMTISGTIS